MDNKNLLAGSKTAKSGVSEEEKRRISEWRFEEDGRELTSKQRERLRQEHARERVLQKELSKSRGKRLERRRAFKSANLDILQDGGDQHNPGPFYDYLAERVNVRQWALTCFIFFCRLSVSYNSVPVPICFIIERVCSLFMLYGVRAFVYPPLRMLEPNLPVLFGAFLNDCFIVMSMQEMFHVYIYVGSGLLRVMIVWGQTLREVVTRTDVYPVPDDWQAVRLRLSTRWFVFHVIYSIVNLTIGRFLEFVFRTLLFIAWPIGAPIAAVVEYFHLPDWMAAVIGGVVGLFIYVCIAFLLGFQWTRDLLREGIEPNPGPSRDDCITALCVATAVCQGDEFALSIVETTRHAVDILTAPDVLSAIVRAGAFAHIYGGDIRVIIDDIWAESSAHAKSESGGDALGSVFMTLVMRGVAMLSVTRVLGAIPNATVRSLVKGVVGVVRDHEELEKSLRNMVGMLSELPSIIGSGDWARLTGPRGTTKLVLEAFELVASAGNPSTDLALAYERATELIEKLVLATAEKPFPMAVVAISNLRSTLAAFRSSVQAAGRLAPFGVEFVGHAGCGKTVFVRELMPLLLEATGGAMVAGAVAHYRRSNFVGDWLTPNVSGVVFDDPLPSTMVAGIAPDYAEFIAVVQHLLSNQPFPTETAALEGKQGHFAAPRVVVVIGNKAIDVQLKHIATDMSAIRRRFLSVTVESFGAPVGDGPLRYARSWSVSVRQFDVVTDKYVDIIRSNKVEDWLTVIVDRARYHRQSQLSLLGIGRTAISGGVHPELRAIIPPLFESGRLDCDQHILCWLTVDLLELGFAGLFAAAIMFAVPWSIYIYTQLTAPVQWSSLVPGVVSLMPASVLRFVSLRSSGQARLLAFAELARRSSPLVVTAIVAFAAYFVVRRSAPRPEVQDGPGAPTEVLTTTVKLGPPMDSSMPPIVLSERSHDVLRANPLGAVSCLPELARGLRARVWSCPHRQPIPVSDLCVCDYTKTVARVEGAMFRLFTGVGMDCRSVAAFRLMKGFAVAPYHAIVRCGFPVVLRALVRTSTNQFCILREAEYTEDDFVFEPSRDIAMFCAPFIPIGAHLTLEDFPDEQFRQPTALLLELGPDTRNLSVTTRVVPFRGSAGITVVETTSVRVDTLRFGYAGGEGKCGNLALDPKTFNVVSMHSFGWPGTEVSGHVSLVRGPLATLLAALVGRCQIPAISLAVYPAPAFADARFSLTDRDLGSWSYPGENMALLGAFERRDDMHSNWRKTTYHSLFVGQTEWYPSFIRPISVELESSERAVLNPFQMQLEDTNQLKCSIPPCYMSSFITELLGRVIAEPLQPLSYEQACAAVGDTIRSIDLSKSAGPGFPGKKGSYVRRVGDKYVLEASFRNDLDRFERMLFTDRRAPSSWKMFAKDELRPWRKIRVGGTRFISNPPFTVYLVARKYLAPLCDVLFKHRRRWGCMVGMNAPLEAQGMYDMLLKMSVDGKVFAGDWREFDERFAAAILSLLIASLFYRLALACGYSSGDAMRCAILVSSLCPRFVSIDTIFVLCTSGNPSGTFGTTIFNCIANLFYQWCAYRAMRPYGSPSFWLVVLVATFGDDFVSVIADRKSVV